MKSLSGSELAGFIKERHAKEVRGLRGQKIYPKLAIVQVKDDPVINTYVRLKRKYGSDIGVEVEIHTPPQSEVASVIEELNKKLSVHGIILQLPLVDASQTEELVNIVSPAKDVDALGKKALFDPATPMAILWLLAGYNINLQGKKVLLIGKGRLVGAPLEQMLKDSGVDVSVVTKKNSAELSGFAKEADVIIAAANEPSILTSEMVKKDAVVVDAGVAGEGGNTTGNVAPDVYQRTDISITPHKGGVGPLTVCALFENVILAAKRSLRGQK